MQGRIVAPARSIRHRDPVLEHSLVKGERQDGACPVVERVNLRRGKATIEELEVAHIPLEGAVVGMLIRLAVRPQPHLRVRIYESQVGLAVPIRRGLPVDVRRQQPIPIPHHHQVMPDVRRKQSPVADQRLLTPVQLHSQRDVVRGVGLKRQVVVAAVAPVQDVPPGVVPIQLEPQAQGEGPRPQVQVIDGTHRHRVVAAVESHGPASGALLPRRRAARGAAGALALPGWGSGRGEIAECENRVARRDVVEGHAQHRALRRLVVQGRAQEQ